MTDLPHPLRVTVTHPETRPGGPDRPAQLRVEWPGGSLAMYSTFVEGRGAASAVLDHIAVAIPACGADLADIRSHLEQAEKVADDAKRAARRYRERLRAVLGETRGIGAFGDILVREIPGAGAWLLDPEKREAGFGLRFDSLDDVWRSHPHLRPVRWGADADGPFLIVRPLALAEEGSAP